MIGPQESKRFNRQDYFALLGALGAFVTIATAAMLYFGWRRSEAQARAMGIDVSLFGFSSQDYVLRSIGSMYVPLLAFCGLVIGLVVLHGALSRRVRSPRTFTESHREHAVVVLRMLIVVLVLLAVAAVLFLWEANARSPRWPVNAMRGSLNNRRWIVPFTLVVSTLGATYATWIRRQLAPLRLISRSPWRAPLLSAAVVGTVTLGCFWLLEDYAANVGARDAELLAAHVRDLPSVVVLSPFPLQIDAAGVTEERLTFPGAPDRYRTTGLRLLGRSGGKIVLVHNGWSLSTGSIIVVADTDELTWQFAG